MQKQLDKKTIVGIVSGVVALLAVIIAVATYKPTIKLNDYVNVSFSGYDTVGTAKAVFDVEAFCKDYEGKLKKLEGSESTGAELFAKRVEGKLDKSKRLTNGDEITYQWDFSVSTLENVFNCKIKCSDIKLTVEGLEKAEVRDVFENIEFSYKGVAPFATVSVVNNGTEAYERALSFYVEDSFNLSNGDTFTVCIDFSEDYGDVESYVEAYGIIPEMVKKEFVVEGVPEYITKTSQLSDDILDSLKQQAEVVHSQHVAEKWKNGEFGSTAKVTGLEYVGAHVLTAIGKNGVVPSYNRVLMVYKVNARAESTFENLSMSGDVTYYTTIVFDNTYIESDGTLVISDSYVPEENSLRYKLTHTTNSWYVRYYTFYGHITLEELFKKEVTSKSNTYTYETTIKGGE